MDRQPEAESKLKRIDKQKERRMEIESDEVVRARYLMTPFNVNEAKRHTRQRRAIIILIGAMLVGLGGAVLLLTVWNK
jgi:hypothetical protein